MSDTMVKLGLLVLFSSFFSFFATAEERADPEYVPHSVSTSDEGGDNFSWMIDHPKFKECQKEEGEKATDCIKNVWNDPSKLSDTDKEELREAFEKLKENPVASNSPLGFEKTESGKRLTQYLTDRLGDIIHKSTGNQLAVFDHTEFYRLYNTQLSKNAIMALSSYCLDANLTTYKISDDEEKRKTQRLDNLKMLQTWQPPMGNQNQDPFVSCYASIPAICDPCSVNSDEDQKKLCQSNKGTITSGDAIKSSSGDPQEEYSQQRACEVRNTLEKVRNTMADLAVVQAKVKKELSDDGPNLITDGSKLKLTLNDLQENEITSISSKEIMEGAKLDDVAKSEKGFMERCLAANNKDNEDCKKILFEKEDLTNFNKQAQEIELQSLLERQKIEKAIQDAKSGDDEDLKAYLKSKGHSEKEIATMMAGQYGKTLADQLYYQLKLNKEAVIKRTRDKIKSRMAKDDKGVGKEIADIDRDYKNQEEQLQQLIHFNNVVTAFLPVGKTEERNGLTLDLEIEGSAFDAKDDPTGKQYGKQDLEGLKDKLGGRAEIFTADKENPICFGITSLNNLILGRQPDQDDNTRTTASSSPDLLNDSECD